MRVFSGIKLDNNVRNEIRKLLLFLEKAKERLKIVSSNNLHITLRFLGNLSCDDVEKYSRRLSDECLKLKPFSITAKGVGFFPNKNSVRVIWAGLEESPELRRIHSASESAAQQIGLAPEKKFHAHITVCRVRSSIPGVFIQDIEKNFQSTLWGKIDVDEITIFESILHPDGPEYKELINIHLGGN